MGVVKQIEATKTDAQDRPVTAVVIADCGMVNEAGIGGEIGSGGMFDPHETFERAGGGIGGLQGHSAI